MDQSALVGLGPPSDGGGGVGFAGLRAVLMGVLGGEGVGGEQLVQDPGNFYSYFLHRGASFLIYWR